VPTDAKGDAAPKGSKRKPAEPKAATEPKATGADEAPRRRRGPASKAERRRADLKVIESGFSELLIDTPAMLGTLTADPWLVDHTSLQGPLTVMRIVAEAERSDRFREIALKAVSGQSIAMLLVALGSYLVPIGAHYGIVPGAEQLGIPKKSLSFPRPGGVATGPPFKAGGNGRPQGPEPEPQERAAEPPPSSPPIEPA
jgi:hypothetical protein